MLAISLDFFTCVVREAMAQRRRFGVGFSIPNRNATKTRRRPFCLPCLLYTGISAISCVPNERGGVRGRYNNLPGTTKRLYAVSYIRGPRAHYTRDIHRPPMRRRAVYARDRYRVWPAGRSLHLLLHLLFVPGAITLPEWQRRRDNENKVADKEARTTSDR